MGKIVGLGIAISAVLALGIVGVLPQSASAQTTSGSGMRISPVRTELTIKPGESKEVNVFVTNVTESPTSLKAVVNDFGAGDDETGQAKIYLDENSSAPSHGLKKYVKPIENINLEPKERKQVKVTIAMPAGVAGGGYFGAVRFLPVNTPDGKNVTLSGSVGSLILVTVPGDVREEASIASFNVARYNGDTLSKASNFFTNGKVVDKKGLQVGLRVKNSGNVQVAPFGKVILTKSGKEVATYEINDAQPRSNVLPDSIRRFEVDLGDKTSSFGKYTVEGNFGYGSKGQLLSAKTSFWVVPLAYVLVGVGILLVIVAALLILPRMLRSHDRKLIRKIRNHK